jgi:hypothetical protein
LSAPFTSLEARGISFEFEAQWLSLSANDAMTNLNAPIAETELGGTLGNTLLDASTDGGTYEVTFTTEKRVDR